MAIIGLISDQNHDTSVISLHHHEDDKGGGLVIEALTNKGFAVLPEVPAESVMALAAFYAQWQPELLSGFHPTLMRSKSEERKQISLGICSRLQGYLLEYFPDYLPLYGSFMVKEPGVESKMKLHQDWAYVKEEERTSLALWFPLTDLNQSNGALHVVPQSHIFPNYVRGPGTFCPFSENSEEICRVWGQPLYLKRGQPVVWQHRLLHYSPANLSSTPRIAVTVILVPANADVIHYFKPEENDIVQEYSVHEDFYFNYEIGVRPQKNVTLIKEFEHRMPTYSRSALAEVLDQEKPVWSKLRRFLTFRQ